MEKDLIKEYSNDEITVVWKPATCIHSAVCWRQATGLPEVFNPGEKPWIKIEGASSAAIMAQVQQCPSGALSFFRNEEEGNSTDTEQETRIEMLPGGPLLIYGNITVKDKTGRRPKRAGSRPFAVAASPETNPIAMAAIFLPGLKIKFRDLVRS